MHANMEMRRQWSNVTWIMACNSIEQPYVLRAGTQSSSDYVMPLKLQGEFNPVPLPVCVIVVFPEQSMIRYQCHDHVQGHQLAWSYNIFVLLVVSFSSGLFIWIYESRAENVILLPLSTFHCIGRWYTYAIVEIFMNIHKETLLDNDGI